MVCEASLCRRHTPFNADVRADLGLGDGDKRPDKKRVFVSYKGMTLTFVWRKTAPPELLQARLSRLLEPSIDPRALVLVDEEDEECDLCDSLENDCHLNARFLEIRLATLPMAVSPAVIAEVVGVKKPVANRERPTAKVARVRSSC